MNALKQKLLLDRCSLIANNIENSGVPSSDHDCFVNSLVLLLLKLMRVLPLASVEAGYVSNYLRFASLKFGSNCKVKAQAQSQKNRHEILAPWKLADFYCGFPHRAF